VGLTGPREPRSRPAVGVKARAQLAFDGMVTLSRSCENVLEGVGPARKAL
jgi:hypothetical protein